MRHWIGALGVCLALFVGGSVLAQEKPEDRVVVNGFQAGMKLDEALQLVKENGWFYALQYDETCREANFVRFYLDNAPIDELRTAADEPGSGQFIGCFSGLLGKKRPREYVDQTVALLHFNDGILAYQSWGCEVLRGCNTTGDAFIRQFIVGDPVRKQLGETIERFNGETDHGELIYVYSNAKGVMTLGIDSLFADFLK
ncbi:hypothetical protein GCM10023174_10570 [Chelativorans composti]|uniref:Uncharacterized protein n=1 Tax=Chelativorans composti TaxID=768533 RepID=A0ABW5DKL8_9HYPH